MQKAIVVNHDNLKELNRLLEEGYKVIDKISFNCFLTGQYQDKIIAPILVILEKL